jgi:hypothetical protein
MRIRLWNLVELKPERGIFRFSGIDALVE